MYLLRTITAHALLVALCSTAASQTLPPSSRTVFKCEAGGKTIYSDSPCVGAQRIDAEPTRGLTTNPGRDPVGADVRREHRREGLANAVRPITGLDAKQFEVQGRRMQLSADAQRECRRLDAAIPATEVEEKPSAKRDLAEVQARLFTLRQRFKDLRC
jgi:hypothetical protein